MTKKETTGNEPSLSERLSIAVEEGADLESIPRIIASGKGRLGEEILRLAFDHGIRVRQDPALAKMLATADIDCEIPTDALLAVAEILAYVYRADGQEPPSMDWKNKATQPPHGPDLGKETD